nr:HK97 family phage prohead protease [Arthrobacter sp. SDTb3-6]
MALVSAFGNEDSQGDIIQAGAFTKTLAEWTLKDRPIPVVWSHQFTDPESILGKYVEAQETDAGLLLKGQLDLDHPKAARIHKLMLDGLIVEFSISGQVRDYELIKSDGEESWWPSLLIKDIDLWEAGPCFKGANPDTELLSIKSDGRLTGAVRTVAKEGRVLAQKHVTALKDAHAQLGEIIAAVDTQDADKTKTAPVPAVPAAKSVLSPNVRALLDLSL